MALEVFGRLPVSARRRVVRTIAPSYTVGAICVIERADGSLLLVRLSYRNRWGLPGGLLKRGEDPADGARREVLEESGLEIDLLGEPAVVVDPPAQRIDIVFRARPAAGVDPAEVATSSPEIVELAWFPADALPDLQFEASGALIALARQAVSRPGTTPGVDAGPSRGAEAS